MGTSMTPDSGKPRFDASDLPRRPGITETATRLYGYLGGNKKLADVLPILQARYRPPATTDDDGSRGDAFGTRLCTMERELTLQQLRFRAQITDRVENAIKCSRLVASFFAGAVVILEVAHLVRIFQTW